MPKECKAPVIMIILRGFSLYNERQTIDRRTAWIWLAILMQTLLVVLILVNQHLRTFSSWPVELFLGEVSNKL